MAEEDLFERAGGLPGISALVDKFYERVMADDHLAPFFEKTSQERLRRMQTEFFSAALGGEAVYTGPSLREVHAGRGIRKSHLRRFMNHLLATLGDLELTENEINGIYSRIALYSDEITGETTVDG